jgi:hypothetical protein
VEGPAPEDGQSESGERRRALEPRATDGGRRWRRRRGQPRYATERPRCSPLPARGRAGRWSCHGLASPVLMVRPTGPPELSRQHRFSPG